VTGGLHLQIHPSAVRSLHIAPLPAGVERKEGQLYPEGGEVTNLEEVRKIVYGLQRPGISPELVYPHGQFSRGETRAGRWNEGRTALIFFTASIMRLRLGRGRYGSLSQPR